MQFHARYPVKTAAVSICSNLNYATTEEEKFDITETVLLILDRP